MVTRLACAGRGFAVRKKRLPWGMASLASRPREAAQVRMLGMFTQAFGYSAKPPALLHACALLALVATPASATPPSWAGPPAGHGPPSWAHGGAPANSAVIPDIAPSGPIAHAAPPPPGVAAGHSVGRAVHLPPAAGGSQETTANAIATPDQAVVNQGTYDIAAGAPMAGVAFLAASGSSFGHSTAVIRC